MIIVKGIWECFHCGSEYPNRILQCNKCNASRKHSKNMRSSLGMDARPDIEVPSTRKKHSEWMSKVKSEREKYNRVKMRIEGFISKFFRFALNLRVFKDELGNVKGKDDRLYYGFDMDGYHYTVRRDKVEGERIT